MEIFGIGPSKAVGDIKNSIKDAILDGEIQNNYEAAYGHMIRQAEGLGLKPVKSLKNN
jgi:poly(A) polymerase